VNNLQKIRAEDASGLLPDGLFALHSILRHIKELANGYTPYSAAIIDE
jgi:hypothetical protein